MKCKLEPNVLKISPIIPSNTFQKNSYFIASISSCIQSFAVHYQGIGRFPLLYTSNKCIASNTWNKCINEMCIHIDFNIDL